MCALYVVRAGSGGIDIIELREGLGSREGFGDGEDGRLGECAEGKKVPDSRRGRSRRNPAGMVRKMDSQPGDSA